MVPFVANIILSCTGYDFSVSDLFVESAFFHGRTFRLVRFREVVPVDLPLIRVTNSHNRNKQLCTREHRILTQGGDFKHVVHSRLNVIRGRSPIYMLHSFFRLLLNRSSNSTFFHGIFRGFRSLVQPLQVRLKDKFVRCRRFQLRHSRANSHGPLRLPTKGVRQILILRFTSVRRIRAFFSPLSSFITQRSRIFRPRYSFFVCYGAQTNSLKGQIFRRRSNYYDSFTRVHHTRVRANCRRQSTMNPFRRIQRRTTRHVTRDQFTNNISSGRTSRFALLSQGTSTIRHRFNHVKVAVFRVLRFCSARPVALRAVGPTEVAGDGVFGGMLWQ